ncbi:MAG: histidinol-phosphate transaminase [Phycisphaeraceae bacterium]
MAYERQNIQRMAGYVPGEQPADADVIKLNTNENPYQPAEPVLQAMRGVEAEALRRYPPPTAMPFREAAAELHGVHPENILATNGGDELLRLLITTFVEPGESIGVTEPSYSLYPVLAAVQDAPVVRVALHDDWSMPDDLAEQMNAAGVKLTLVVNPHAPSGTLADVATLRALATQLDGVLVIDEAYVDFVDPDLGYDAVGLVREMANVVILRSLSKGYSLAGLRFGYGIGSAGLIEPMLTKTKDSYNTDIVSQRVATAAIRHRDLAIRNCEAVRRERASMTEALAKLGLSCPPSQSNFVLASVPDDCAGGAKALHEALKQQGIFVRYFDQDRLRDKLRITIGTPRQNHALLEALQAQVKPVPQPQSNPPQNDR